MPRLEIHPRRFVIAAAMVVGVRSLAAQTPTVPPPAPQNPSPMVEHKRAHARLPQQDPAGSRRSFVGPLDKPVQVFVPAGGNPARRLRLVVHFHGAAFIPEIAASRLGKQYVVATVNVGSGSGVYDRTFREPAVFDSLRASITREAATTLGQTVTINHITLVGFSAGHGAIRAILRDSAHFAAINAVLLLDGLHTSYVPEATVIEKGGTLDESNLEVFVRYRQAAIRGEKRFLRRVER